MNFFKLILIDTILDIIYFPIWWYSRGAILAFKWMVREILGVEKFLGVGIWVKNLFKPMYGQTDWQGKIVSFFMRVVQIIVRSLALFGFSLFYTLLFIIYIVLPISVIYMILVHLPGLF